MAKNFRKFCRRGGNSRRGNRFDNRGNDSKNKVGRGQGFDNKVGESSRCGHGCFNCGDKSHFISGCPNPRENKAFVRGAWSDSEDGDQHDREATCLMAIGTNEVSPNSRISNNNLDIHKLQKDNEELTKFNENFTKTFEKLIKEKCSLE